MNRMVLRRLIIGEYPTPKTEAGVRSAPAGVDRALERLSERGIRFLDLRFVDVLGTVKSITIPVQRLPHAVRHGEWFDGSSVEGFARIFESDMFLRPDLGTLSVGETDGRATAQVICDLLTPDGEQFAGDPRGVLARALADFMPKPTFAAAGSGMLTHQVLSDSGKDTNAFFDRADQYGLSAVAKHFIAGQLAHARGLCAVVAPLVNSYKRFTPGFEAPVAISWAQMNRSALIRVPRVSSSDRAAIRVEFRAPDPSCNPYLAFAAMLHAGLSGIRQKLALAPPVEENLYAFDPERLARHQLGQLPGSLAEALRSLRQDEVLREALGVHLLERFIEAKEIEWQTYEKQVSAWELDAYLETY